MTTTLPPTRTRGRLGFFLLLLTLPLLAWAAIAYQQQAARERAAELEAYCATPGSGAFSLKLACIPRRDQ